MFKVTDLKIVDHPGLSGWAQSNHKSQTRELSLTGGRRDAAGEVNEIPSVRRTWCAVAGPVM